MVAPSCGNSMMAGMDLGAATTSFQPDDGDGGSIGRAWISSAIFLFSKIHFLCWSATTDTINRSFFVSYKLYLLRADTKYRFPTDTTNTFVVVVSMLGCKVRTRFHPPCARAHRASLFLMCASLQGPSPPHVHEIVGNTIAHGGMARFHRGELRKDR
jgi:hypothetical protein